MCDELQGSGKTPHPGGFAERVWKLMKRQEIDFWKGKRVWKSMKGKEIAREEGVCEWEYRFDDRFCYDGSGLAGAAGCS
jgi:hypothetical protein